MKMIIQFMKDYKKESVLAPLFKMLEAMLELLVPLVVASIIDQGIYRESRHYIFMMCLVLFALALVGLLFPLRPSILRPSRRWARRRPCVPGCLRTSCHLDTGRWMTSAVPR